jgi:hypothetical protein
MYSVAEARFERFCSTSLSTQTCIKMASLDAGWRHVAADRRSLLLCAEGAGAKSEHTSGMAVHWPDCPGPGQQDIP